MKNFRFLIINFCLLLTISLSAQGESSLQENPFDGNLPPTPNAASLGKYGEVPISYNIGTPEIDIPLFTISQEGLSVPISLSYHSSGIKVAQASGHVGLGWSLNAGGVITRTVRNAPDEGVYQYSEGFLEHGTPNIPFEETNQGTQGSVWNLYHSEWVAAANGRYDTEPDIFFFNFNGQSGKFFFNTAGEIQIASDSGLKIERVSVDQCNAESGGNPYVRMYFVVTAVDGVKYYFGGEDGCVDLSTIDFSKTSSESSIYGPTVSSWYLKKIVHPNVYSNNEIVFEYEKQKFAMENLSPKTSSPVDLTECTIGSASGGTINITYQEECRLTKVIGKYNTVELTGTTIREDLTPVLGQVYPSSEAGEPKAIEQIKVLGDLGGCLFQYNLDYSYFVSPQFTGNSEDLIGDYSIPGYEKRLKLLSLSKETCDASIAPEVHTFDYNTISLPNRVSKAQDHWGYYNAQNSDNLHHNVFDNTKLYTASMLDNASQFDHLNCFTAPYGNRDANANVMGAGILKKITYPSLATSSFEYEAHTVNGHEKEKLVTPLGYDTNCGHPGDCSCTNTTEAILNDIILSAPQNNERLLLKLKVWRGADCSNNNYTQYPGNLDVTFRIDDASGQNILNDDFLLAEGMDVFEKVFLIEDDLQSVVFGQSYDYTLASYNPHHAKLELEIVSEGYEIVPKNLTVGGLRIKRMINDPVSSPSIITEFDYNNEEGDSYGLMVGLPKYLKTSYAIQGAVGTNVSGECDNGSQENGVPGYLSSSSITDLSSSNGSHVSYSNITKKIVGGSNGETRMEFYSDYIAPSGFISSTYHSYPSDNNLPPTFGKLKEQQEVDEEGGVVKLERYEYKTIGHAESDGIVYTQTSPCASPFCGTCIPTDWPQIIKSIPYKVIATTAVLERQITTLDNVTTDMRYTYHEGGIPHKQVLTKTFTNSDGKEHKVVYKYAHDVQSENIPGFGLGLSQMIEKNMIGIPLQVEKHVGGQIVGGTRIVYSAQNESTSYPALNVPKEFWNYEEGWVKKVTAHTYNSNGKLLMYRPENQPYQFELEWDNGLLVSQVQNMDTEVDLTQSWLYHPNSRLVSRTTAPDCQEVDYDYDSFMRLANTSARGGEIKTITDYYTGSVNKIVNQVDYIEYADQLTESYFDGFGRVTSTIGIGSGPEGENQLLDASTYDNVGRLASKLHRVGGGMEVITYESSPLNRSIVTMHPDGNSMSQNYGNAGQYYLETITDENGNPTIAKKDIIGQLISSEDALGGQTLYEYTDKGSIEKVISPMGQIYSYAYDFRNRLVSKKIPAKAIESYVYDDRDLLITSQDGNQALAGNWLVTNYDEYGRPYKTGFGTAQGIISEELTSTTYIKDNCSPGQTGQVSETSSRVINPDGSLGNASINKFTYDEYGRSINVSTTYGLGGTDEMTSLYNGADLVMSSNRVHNYQGAINMHQTYTYDHAMRSKGTTHQIGSNPIEQLVKNSYNGSNDLIQTRLGGNLQNVNYAYNVMGWMTDINGITLPKLEEAPRGGEGCDSEIIIEDEVITETVVGTDIIDVLIQNEGEVIIGDPCDNTSNVNSGSNDKCRDSEDYSASDVGRSRVFSTYFNESMYDNLTGLFPGSENTLTIPNKWDLSPIKNKGEVMWDVGYDLSSSSTVTSFEVCANLQLQRKTSGIIRLGLSDGTNFYSVNGGKEYMEVELRSLSLQDGYSFCLVLDDMPSVAVLSNMQLVMMVDRVDLGYSITVVEAEVGFMGPCEEEEDCIPSPPLCSEEELEAQSAFVAQMLTQLQAMANDPNIFPLNLTLVQLCDGTVLYVPNVQVSNIPGTYNVIDEVVIFGNESYEVTLKVSGDLFSMHLNYYDSDEIVNGAGQRNGNIASMDWQVGQNRYVQKYGFQYDALNRVKGGNFVAAYSLFTETVGENGTIASQGYETNYDAIGRYNLHGLNYDKDGNIQSLSRNGIIGPNCRTGLVDALSYKYAPKNSNADLILTSVEENGNLDHGKKKSSGYTYDVNGNMTSDDGKGIKSIEYNYLNLPRRIVFEADEDGNVPRIDIWYDANGVKLRQEAIKQDEISTTNYVGGVNYLNDELEGIYTEVGRVAEEKDLSTGEVTGWYYEYSLLDHLGNSRVRFADLDKNGEITTVDDSSTEEEEPVEVLQENHYYPFGMNMEGEWTGVISNDKYQYNGKELTSDFGLELNDYGARWYDSQIGRFTTSDRFSEKYYSITPYQYGANNPVNTVDINGDSIIVLSAPKAVHGAGHAAVLIGSDRDDDGNGGWQFYSKNGTTASSGASGDSDANDAEGRVYGTLEDFANSDDNLNDEGEQKYTEGYLIESDAQTDVDMKDAAQESLDRPYDVASDNCIDMCSSALEAGCMNGGNNIRVPLVMPAQGLNAGNPTIVTTKSTRIPNVRYQQIRKNNPGGTDIPSDKLKPSTQ